MSAEQKSSVATTDACAGVILPRRDQPSVAEVVALLRAATPPLVRSILRMLGHQRTRTVLATLSERTDVPMEQTLSVFRAAMDVQPDVVTELALGENAYAVRVCAELRYARDESGTMIPRELLSGHFDLDPKVALKALRGRTLQEDPTTVRRILARTNFASMDYIVARQVAREFASIPAAELGRLELPSLRAAIVGDVTTSYLASLLPMALLVHGVNASVFEAPFGQLEEILLDPGSDLARWRPDVVVLLGSSLTLRGQDVAKFVDQRVRFSHTVSERLGADTIMTTWEPTPDHASPGGAAGSLAQMNALLRSSLPRRAHLFDLAALVAEMGVHRWFDLRLWAIARQPFSLEWSALLADRLARFVRAWIGSPIKLIVTDLDGTLWGGIAGEVDARELQVDPDADGMGHLRLQQYLRDRVAEGFLLAACSKSSLQAAQAPFRAHPEMPLTLDHFVAFHASFAPKAVVIPEIIKELGLGLSHTLFLDDSHHERAEMRELVPDVIVPEWPFDGVIGLPGQLARSGLLLRVRATAEDAQRVEMYRREKLRASARESFADTGEYLKSLGLAARFTPLVLADRERVAQLTQKTNQFNLTTSRWSRREMDERAARPGSYAFAVSVHDRHGPYGLTAVLVAGPSGPHRLVIENWLMSCQIMGKTIELAMFEHLLRFARSAGYTNIEGMYRRTPRNGEVAALYPRLGFRETTSGPNQAEYVFDVSTESALRNHYVTIEEDRVAARELDA